MLLPVLWLFIFRFPEKGKKEELMPTTKVGDINMYYEIHGNGEPLVMINGAGASVEWSGRSIPVYSKDYQLILFDNRGAGKTDIPDLPYTTEMMADDLAGLLESLNIGPVHVWGLSMGGMIAQQFVLRYPNRVKSLILACTACGGPYDEAAFNISTANDAINQCITPGFIDKNPILIQQMREMMTAQLQFHQGTIRQRQAVRNHNTYDRLSEITSPTLIIHGDADQVFPVENARILASRIPNAGLSILKNTGHMLIEAGDEPDRLILDFLKRHNGPGK
jgi:3-oxoadipate enol-lactonase